MSLISILTFGLVKPKEDHLWVLDQITYAGPTDSKLSHTYRARIVRGIESRMIDYHFRTTKRPEKLRAYVQVDVDKLNAAIKS